MTLEKSAPPIANISGQCILAGELFDAIDEPWGRDHGNRWIAFSIDGKYCYPSDGSVIDADTGQKTSMRISASEKLVEVEFDGDQAVRVSGQMGGVYGGS